MLVLRPDLPRPLDPSGDRAELDAVLDEAQRTYDTRTTIPHETVMAELRALRDPNRT